MTANPKNGNEGFYSCLMGTRPGSFEKSCLVVVGQRLQRCAAVVSRDSWEWPQLLNPYTSCVGAAVYKPLAVKGGVFAGWWLADE